MTTSNGNGNRNGNGDGNGHHPVSLSDLAVDFVPDEAEIAKLANDMFREALSFTAPAIPTMPEPSIPEVVVPAFPMTPSFPASPSFAVPGNPTLPSAPSVPGLGRSLAGMQIPGGAPASPDTTAFYFMRAPAPPGAPAMDPMGVRKDFPILHQTVHGKPLVWLDNAATTQKPQAVIDAIARYYAEDNSNVHRAAHALAGRATDTYENARDTVQRFLGAGSSDEIVFVRGTTEAINLVANTIGRQRVGPGDEILLTHLEHHANIVPWQMLAQQTGATLKVAPIDDSGEVILTEYERLLGPRTKVVALAHVSNALGTVLPVADMTQMAHRHGAVVLVDGAQAVSHFPVDVRAIGCDFYAMSGHKLYGPTGIGVLYGRQDMLEQMPPWQGGGAMIKDVTFERTVYNGPPVKFEAGTPIIAGAAGLAAAIDYLDSVGGMEMVGRAEEALLQYACAGLATVPGLTPIGTAAHKAGVLSFVVDWMPTEEMGSFLDKEGIAVRAGHHCAQPALRRFGLEATVRPSLGVYNTTGDIDALVAALHKAHRERRRTP